MDKNIIDVNRWYNRGIGYPIPLLYFFYKFKKNKKLNNTPYWYVSAKININFLKFNTYQQLRKEKKMTGGR